MLFKYIVKREYANENSGGEWSLKGLHVSGQQSKKKPYYRNTCLTRKGEHNQEKRVLLQIFPLLKGYPEENDCQYAYFYQTGIP